MFIKKKAAPAVNRRKAARRKPGDQRFPGRLVGLRKGATRKTERRKLRDRRKK